MRAGLWVKPEETTGIRPAGKEGNYGNRKFFQRRKKEKEKGEW